MKRIITSQDISCVGRCSLTVALPIISAAGVEACILPTAVLSTHTAFPEFTFRDLTDEIQPISDTLARLGIDFDAIYTGYLGSPEQLALVADLIDRFRKPGAEIFIDPVLGDNGSLYKGFTQDFADRMTRLCAKADLILPNMTEAAFMLHEDYREDYDEDYVRGLLVRLTSLGARRPARRRWRGRWKIPATRCLRSLRCGWAASGFTNICMRSGWAGARGSTCTARREASSSGRAG